MSWEVFATVFGVIFIAELPDKTALAALVLATRHAATPVFLGAASALTVQSGVAVAFGSVLAKIPARYVHVGAGALFLGCAILMWIRKEDADDAKEDTEQRGFWSTLGKTFAVVFIAEWGDLTQVGTATLQAKYHDALTIFAASALALWCVAAIAVFVGNRAGKLLDSHVTQKIAAAVFAAIGVLLLAGII
jgi:putative Ca2+/H+ antiporter (TMEM165/GDT1 family)